MNPIDMSACPAKFQSVLTFLKENSLPVVIYFNINNVNNSIGDVLHLNTNIFK